MWSTLRKNEDLSSTRLRSDSKPSLGQKQRRSSTGTSSKDQQDKRRSSSVFRRNPVFNRLFRHQSSYERRFEQRRIRFERYEQRRENKVSAVDRYLARWFALSQHLSRFWVTHVFLFLIMVVYTIAGAYIFMTLEYEAEDAFRRKAAGVRNHVLKELWEGCTQAETLGKRKWTTKLKTLMWGNRGTLCKTDQWVEEGEHLPNPAHPWNLPNAMMFCCTIFTTIGYGLSTPRTVLGRLFTILYAFIGIPYCLVLLTDMGEVMRVGLKRLYIVLFKFYYLGKCCRWRIVSPYARITRFVASTPFFVIDDTPSNDSDTAPTSNTDLTPQARFHDHRDSLYELAGVHESDFILPIWIGLALLCLYLVSGALLFVSFENWDFTESLYFLSISLTTIGFGDLMPEKINFAYIFFYVLIGLALASFFFALLLENSRRSMRKATHKVTKAIATRISDATGDDYASGDEDYSPPDYGDVLDVHVVTLPGTIVTGQGLVQLPPQHRSNAAGLPNFEDQKPVVLVQFSDPRLLDYMEDDQYDRQELMNAARKLVLQAKKTHTLLRNLSSTSSATSPDSPGIQHTFQISEKRFLEYIKERQKLLKSYKRSLMQKKGSLASEKSVSTRSDKTVHNSDTDAMLQTAIGRKFGSPDSHQMTPTPELQRFSQSEAQTSPPETQVWPYETQRTPPESIRRSLEVQRRSPAYQQPQPTIQQLPSKPERRSPEYQRRSPEYQRRSPERQRRSPEHQRRSPEYQRRSPEHQQRSPERQRQSPKYQRQSREQQRPQPAIQRQSPEFQGLQPATTKQSPEYEQPLPVIQQHPPESQIPVPELGLSPQVPSTTVIPQQEIPPYTPLQRLKPEDLQPELHQQPGLHPYTPLQRFRPDELQTSPPLPFTIASKETGASSVSSSRTEIINESDISRNKPEI